MHGHKSGILALEVSERGINYFDQVVVIFGDTPDDGAKVITFRFAPHLFISLKYVKEPFCTSVHFMSIVMTVGQAYTRIHVVNRRSGIALSIEQPDINLQWSK